MICEMFHEETHPTSMISIFTKFNVEHGGRWLNVDNTLRGYHCYYFTKYSIKKSKYISISKISSGGTSQIYYYDINKLYAIFVSNMRNKFELELDCVKG